MRLIAYACSALLVFVESASARPLKQELEEVRLISEDGLKRLKRVEKDFPGCLHAADTPRIENLIRDAIKYKEQELQRSEPNVRRIREAATESLLFAEALKREVIACFGKS